MGDGSGSAEAGDLTAVDGFFGAMASGIEEAVGEPANSITYLAGKKLGRRFFGASIAYRQRYRSAVGGWSGASSRTNVCGNLSPFNYRVGRA